MFGFTWYQSKEAIEKQKAQQEAIAKQQKEALDSLAAYSLSDTLTTEVLVSEDPEIVPVAPVDTIPHFPFKDEVLNASYKRWENRVVHTLSNDVIEIEFTTKGAQPYSVKLDKFNAYNPESPKKPKELYLMKKGWSDYSLSFELDSDVADTVSTLKTDDFVFNIIDSSSTHIVMQLPFEGGYIQQKYWLEKGEYMVRNELEIVGLNKLVTDTTKTYTADWNIVIPRLEKGHTNEKR